MKGKKKEIKKTRKRGVKENKDIGLTANQTKKKGSTSLSKKKVGANFMDSSNKQDIKKDKDKKEKQIYIFGLENLLKLVLRIVQLNIKLIFKNRVIDDDFLNSLIKICFDSMEIVNESKSINTKDKIFEILQIIVTKYQNIQILLIKLTTKIVNLIYNQEALVGNLSEFVNIATNGSDSNMNKLAVDIVQEISKTIYENQNSDSQGLKNVGKFLVNLSEKSPKIMFANMSYLINLFNCESYVIRNSLVEILANIIVNFLCRSDNISNVDVRNSYIKSKENYIGILFERIYDKNSFCRSKVLQIFDRLCENNTISLDNYLKLLNEASRRLKDDKSQVRKRAVCLINSIIKVFANVFKSDRFLTVEEINNLIKNTNETIDKLNEDIKRISESQVKISEKYDKLNINTGNITNHFLFFTFQINNFTR